MRRAKGEKIKNILHLDLVKWAHHLPWRWIIAHKPFEKETWMGPPTGMNNVELVSYRLGIKR